MSNSTPSLIDSLKNSRVYSHKVTGLSIIETHISWVILTGVYAYKIKKPVDFGFLDFSTLAKRKYYCDEELRLNQRFSTDLYLDVVSITGSVSDPVINGVGDVLEYAVKMKEFPQNNLLINRVETPGLSHQQIEDLACSMAEFHRGAARVAPELSGDRGYGSLDSVTAPMLENFSQIRPLLQRDHESQQLEEIYAWTLQALDYLGENIEQRREGGFVRECHGDLHLANIVLINGKIIFFDCMEFNEQLRWIDICSEYAYTLMDFDSGNHHLLSNRLLNKYLEHSGDFSGLKLLKLYKVYRALVRVKVNILRLQQDDCSAMERDKVRDKYRHYLDLVSEYIEDNKPFLAITHGLSASGKSTVSECFAETYNAILLRSDVERKRLHGLKPLQISKPGLKKIMYSNQATEKTFDHLSALADELLKSHFSVIVDATFLSRKLRDKFSCLAAKCGVAFVILDCQASPQTLADRISRRSQLANDASEADIDILRAQRLNQDSLTAAEEACTCSVNTEKELSAAGMLSGLI